MTKSRLDELINDYRTITAPPDLAGSVHARLDAQQLTGNWTLPAFGALATALSLVGLFFLASTDPQTLEHPSPLVLQTPSLGTLSAIKIEKPKRISISVVRLRSVSIPALPRAPKITPQKESDSDVIHDVKIEPQQEKHHVFS